MFNWFRKKPDDPAAKSADNLQSAFADTRRKELDRIAFSKDEEIPQEILEQRLKDPDVNVRDRALEYCQWHRPPKHAEYLAAALNDDSLSIRWKALRHLGTVHSPQAATRLREMFYKDDEKLKGYILMALGNCDDGETAPFLFRLLNETPATEFNYSAGIELGVLKAQVYVELLIQLLNSDEHPKRDGAIWALGGIGDPRATQPLLDLFARNADNVDTRHKILQALKSIPDPAIIDPLLPLITDQPHYIQGAAMKALAQFQDERIIQAIMPSLTSENPDDRASALIALAKIGTPPVIDQLLAAFQRETHPRITVAFIRAFAREGIQQAIPILERRKATADDSLKNNIDEAITTLKTSKPPT
jgi:HEAT repeat protein